MRPYNQRRSCLVLNPRLSNLIGRVTDGYGGATEPGKQTVDDVLVHGLGAVGSALVQVVDGSLDVWEEDARGCKTCN